MIARRRFLAGSASLLGLAARVQAAEADTLVVRADGDIRILDPAFQLGGIEEEVARCLFPTLSRLGDVRDGISWQPDAAAELLQVSPTEIRFRLRDGLAWTGNYGPVTADDVKFSFERIADPASNSPWAYAFAALDTVEITGRESGVIRLKHPYVPFMVSSLGFWVGHIVCRKAVDSVGGRFSTVPPATCGAYLIHDWQPKESLTLEANPDWPGPAPPFRRIRYRIVEDSDTALLAFEARAVDYTRIGLNALALYRKSRAADVELIDIPGLRYSWLTINIAHPKLRDQRVRRAIQHAIDVDQVLAGAYSDVCRAATGPVLQGMVGWRDRVLYPFDPDKARKLLAEAGVENLSLELATDTDQVDLLTAQIIQALLADVGIDVLIRSYDEGVYWGLGQKASGDGWQALEMVLMMSTSGVDPSENLVWFRPGQVGAWNWSQFVSDEFETLYQQSVVEPDPAQRGRIMRRMQDLMEESGGFVFLANETYAAVYRRGLKPVILPDDLLDLPRCGR